MDGSYSSALGIRTSKVAHHHGAGPSGGHPHCCRESRNSKPDRPRSGTSTFRRRRRRAAALDGQRGAAGTFRSSWSRLPLRQPLLPRSSRTSLPEGPVGSRESPQLQGRKALRFAGIPAYPRSTWKRQDRPVTPEVAGSSPVAPVKVPANLSILLSAQTPGRGQLHTLSTESTRKRPKKRPKPRLGATISSRFWPREGPLRKRRATTRNGRRSRFRQTSADSAYATPRGLPSRARVTEGTPP